MLGAELTPASAPSHGARSRRAVELVAEHGDLLVLLTTLRAASAESLFVLYFSRPPRGMSNRATYRALRNLVDTGILARQPLLAGRSVYRLRSKAFTLSPRVAARSTDATRKRLPTSEAEYCWLRSALWAELTKLGFTVGRGREELLALRRFLVDAQSAVVARASAIEREAAALVLDTLRKDTALSPLFRSRCRSCGSVGPLNKALAACVACRGDVDHVLSERRYRCARCGAGGDAPEHGPAPAPGRRCDGGELREVDHLRYDVAWRVVDGKRDVMLVLVDDPGRSIAAQLDELPLRVVGQPRLPIILRSTDSSSSFDIINKEWITRGDRHRELLRAFSDEPGRGAFPFRTTAEVVDVRPELQLRLNAKRKAKPDA